ncbi:JmjC domain-containing protein [Marinactinospora thermotolerans]|uniref:Cupin superfamily protein n=1 Tax=Marinactinospora thermotolerans DSM 45154 TaxID=1122192 RepID=A0A1T4TCY9_9ACTN|nr:cupin domain-containing protein [Marinactinospora thermotolerans]SKA38410.1 Cupin superfamily protein [Marinactinospora thermotolerans DSM 45154]
MTDRLFTETLRAAVGADLLSSRLSEEFVFADIGAGAVAPLLDFEALGELLSTRPLGPPRLRLHREGRPVPAARYATSGAGETRVRPEDLYRELREGASLVLDGIDRLHPPIRAAADDLMRLVREQVQVNLYLIWGDSHGFDTHWDDHDTFIVQVAGAKSWQVHGQGSRPYPMKVDTDHSHTPPDGVVWEGTLRPGQVLHVPRGWWHTVTGAGTVSMHLTFGFTRATGVDWVRSLLDRLHDVEAMRRDLPRFATPEERRKHHHELVSRLVDLAERHDLDAFLAERDARFPRRRSFSLPWAVEDTPPGPDNRVEYAPILPPRLEEEGDKVALTVAGRRYRLPAAAAPVLAELGRTRSATVAELAERCALPSATVADLVRVLARHHLVVVGGR